ncbi:MAG: ATP-dependent helicase HrpB [Pseudomonadota bacterium]
MASLPIDAVLPELVRTLTTHQNAVLQAAPGAGKTTRVPLALLDQAWLAGRRILMLEPRRLAARNAAYYMSELLGEPVGTTVGYRTRLDSKITRTTRIEVVTEGILTRLLQADPALDGYGLVIFDEFHERNLNTDLGLTLCLESQGALREDLRLLVMSATLETQGVARLLGDAPIITSTGRSFPVTLCYAKRVELRGLSDAVAAQILAALREETGDLLVFLPGVGEIKSVQSRLEQAGLAPAVDLRPLYADLPPAAQEQAILPSPPGRRKIVLATAIAETSLTIEGVRIVIDSGWMRVPRFDPRSGMTRLETIAITQASAEQRSGRAGRLEPGVCYRLWSEEEHARLLAHGQPEIMEADLAPLALELAQWGVSTPADLRWLTPPPPAAFAQAQELLQELDALDADLRITAHGKDMAKLGMHPRLAHMVLKAMPLGLGRLACDLAALLSERDVLRSKESDIRLRLEALQTRTDLPVDKGTLGRVRLASERWRQQLRIDSAPGSLEQTGALLAFAYPDRIAQRRSGAEARYVLANGRGAYFAEHDLLGNEPYLVIPQLDGAARESRIFLAGALNKSDLETHLSAHIRTEEIIAWDDRAGAVQMSAQQRLGSLVLEERPLQQAAPDAIIAAMIAGIRQRGLSCLPWTPELETWRARVKLLRDAGMNDQGLWPDVSEAGLLEHLEDWLAPYLTGITRLSHLNKLDLKSVSTAMLSWPQQQALETLAPTHITVPSGSRIRIDYSHEPPVLAVRLQEMFGLTETPAVANGKIPLLLHLLSPAQRPIQVTQDLASFWRNTYAEVKKDLKGRYPKHYWPDDPMQAVPTHRVRPK